MPIRNNNLQNTTQKTNRSSNTNSAHKRTYAIKGKEKCELPKRLSEVVNRRMVSTIANKKGQKDKQRSTTQN